MENVCNVSQSGDERIISSSTLELARPVTEGRDSAMLGQDNTPLLEQRTEGETHWSTLGRLRESAKRNMPNSIAFSPHRMRKGLLESTVRI